MITILRAVLLAVFLAGFATIVCPVEAAPRPVASSSCDVKCWEVFQACTASEDICVLEFTDCWQSC